MDVNLREECSRCASIDWTSVWLENRLFVIHDSIHDASFNNNENVTKSISQQLFRNKATVNSILHEEVILRKQNLPNVPHGEHIALGHRTSEDVQGFS